MCLFPLCIYTISNTPAYQFTLLPVANSGKVPIWAYLETFAHPVC